MEEEDEDDDEQAIPADEGRIGEVIQVDCGGEEDAVPGSSGDSGSQPHGDEPLLHEDSIREDNREERCLCREGVGAGGYRHAMPYLIPLRGITQEEEYHPGSEEEVDGMEKSFLGIVYDTVRDGLVEEGNGIGGGTDAERHAERIDEDDEEVHGIFISNTPTSWYSRTRGVWRRYR